MHVYPPSTPELLPLVELLVPLDELLVLPLLAEPVFTLDELLLEDEVLLVDDPPPLVDEPLVLDAAVPLLDEELPPVVDPEVDDPELPPVDEDPELPPFEEDAAASFPPPASTTVKSWMPATSSHPARAIDPSPAKRANRRPLGSMKDHTLSMDTVQASCLIEGAAIRARPP